METVVSEASNAVEACTPGGASYGAVGPVKCLTSGGCQWHEPVCECNPDSLGLSGAR